jgi:hypothetical protein
MSKKENTNAVNAVNTVHDTEELKTQEKEYFIKTDTGNKIFILSHSMLIKSKLLESMIELCEEGTTPDNPIILKSITRVSDVLSDVSYRINTVEMFSYVYEYLNIWKDNLKQEDYCKEEICQTGDPLQVLKSKDVTFIKKYLADSITSIIQGNRPFYDNFEVEQYNNIKYYNNYITIRLIGELLAQVDHFLEIPSLTNKLFVYIATILWNSSLMDLHEATKDPYFQNLQKQAVTDWHTENHERVTKYISSYTTGDGKENSDVDEEDPVVDEEDPVVDDDT